MSLYIFAFAAGSAALPQMTASLIVALWLLSTTAGLGATRRLIPSIPAFTGSRSRNR